MKMFLYGVGSVMNIRIPPLRICPVFLFALGQLFGWVATVYILWTALCLIVKATGA